MNKRAIVVFCIAALNGSGSREARSSLLDLASRRLDDDRKGIK